MAPGIKRKAGVPKGLLIGQDSPQRSAVSLIFPIQRGAHRSWSQELGARNCLLATGQQFSSWQFVSLKIGEYIEKESFSYDGEDKLWSFLRKCERKTDLLIFLKVLQDLSPKLKGK